MFNPGVSTLERLVELTREVDFAAFIFGHDDWTVEAAAAAECRGRAASPRDNVVFEAGLFGGALGIRRTFILHAHGSKLPTDLLGLTVDPLRPGHDAGDRPPDQPRAAQGDRSRGQDQPTRGRLVAAFADRTNRLRAVGGIAADDLAATDRRARGRRPQLAGRRHVCLRATGAKHPRRARTRAASSTSTGANGRGTPMPRSSRAPARSFSSRPTARAATGRQGRLAASRPRHPASSGAPTLATGPSSTAMIPKRAPHSSSGAWPSGRQRPTSEPRRH